MSSLLLDPSIFSTTPAFEKQSCCFDHLVAYHPSPAANGRMYSQTGLSRGWISKAHLQEHCQLSAVGVSLVYEGERKDIEMTVGHSWKDHALYGMCSLDTVFILLRKHSTCSLRSIPGGLYIVTGWPHCGPQVVLRCKVDGIFVPSRCLPRGHLEHQGSYIGAGSFQSTGLCRARNFTGQFYDFKEF